MPKWPKGKPKDWDRTWSPVGTIVIRRRKTHRVRMIKIRLDGPRQGRWERLAVYRWRFLHGPIPQGTRVVHLDGDPLNDDPSNYGLMTGGQYLLHLRRLRPTMAQKNARMRRKATAEHNRLRGHVRRQMGFLPTRWYAVDLERRCVINDPHRARWRLVNKYIHPCERTRNGRGVLKFLRNRPVAVVRGYVLAAGRFADFAKVDPAPVQNG